MSLWYKLDSSFRVLHENKIVVVGLLLSCSLTDVIYN